MKSESHVIIDPAHAHGLQRGLDHLQSMLVTVSDASSAEGREGCGVWETWGPCQSPRSGDRRWRPGPA